MKTRLERTIQAALVVPDGGFRSENQFKDRLDIASVGIGVLVVAEVGGRPQRLTGPAVAGVVEQIEDLSLQLSGEPLSESEILQSRNVVLRYSVLPDDVTAQRAEVTDERLLQVGTG